MPRHVEKRPVKSGKDYAIVEPSGKVVGRSETKTAAEASARAANAAKHGWKPSKKGK